jgi:hypothetical protein
MDWQNLTPPYDEQPLRTTPQKTNALHTCQLNRQKIQPLTHRKQNKPRTLNPLPHPTAKCYLHLMDRHPLHLTKWTDRLTFDVALMLEGSGETLDEVKDRHGIDANALLMFNKDPVFLKQVEKYRDEIREKGLTFRLKARAQAEELLTTSYMLIHDPGVSPAVKADLIKSTVKWAGLEPKNTEDNAAAGTGGVRITINLGSNPADARIIDATPVYDDIPDENAHLYQIDHDDEV